VTTGGAVGIGAAVLAVVSAFFIFIFIYRRRKRRASEPAINTPVGPVTGAATTNQM
jgi:heme/copper-type cytochrome/quinol oxidase subunit 2